MVIGIRFKWSVSEKILEAFALNELVWSKVISWSVYLELLFKELLVPNLNSSTQMGLTRQSNATSQSNLMKQRMMTMNVNVVESILLPLHLTGTRKNSENVAVRKLITLVFINAAMSD